jgi:hypothetical protein
LRLEERSHPWEISNEEEVPECNIFWKTKQQYNFDGEVRKLNALSGE